MKKVKFLAMALAATTMLFSATSCSDDEDPIAASLNVTQTNDADGNYVFSVDARAGDNELESLTVINGTAYATDADGKTWDAGTTTNSIGGKINSNSYLKTITFSKSAASKEFKFTLTDENGEVTTVTKTATDGTTPVTGNEISTYTAKLLGAQDASAGSFFASIDGTIYNQAATTANAAKIDITYGVISSQGCLISPSTREALGFGTGVAGGTITKFVKTTVTAAQFDAMTDDSNFPEGDILATDVRGLAKDEVYMFKNSSAKVGLIKIANITAGTSGSVTIDVKVQK